MSFVIKLFQFVFNLLKDYRYDAYLNTITLSPLQIVYTDFYNSWTNVLTGGRFVENWEIYSFWNISIDYPSMIEIDWNCLGENCFHFTNNFPFYSWFSIYYGYKWYTPHYVVVLF